MNYAFGIVRASQLTMADATQSFLQQTLEKGSFTTFRFPTNLQDVSRRFFRNTHFEFQILFRAKGIPTMFAIDYGRKGTCFRK